MDWGYHSLAAAGRANQDVVAVSVMAAGELQPTYLFAIVCDGMGGLDDPEEASRIVASTAVATAFASTATAPGQCLLAANTALLKASAGRDMGVASTCILISGGTFAFAHIGDTRLYACRGGRLATLTTDHSRLADHLGEPTPSALVARSTDLARSLTRSLGERELAPHDIEVGGYPDGTPLEPGDQLVICSDGLWTHTNDQEIYSALRQQNPMRSARMLVDRARAVGSQDDISAVVIRV